MQDKKSVVQKLFLMLISYMMSIDKKDDEMLARWLSHFTFDENWLEKLTPDFLEDIFFDALPSSTTTIKGQINKTQCTSIANVAFEYLANLILPGAETIDYEINIHPNTNVYPKLNVTVIKTIPESTILESRVRFEYSRLLP